jgi:hypothetical protein
MAKTFKKKERKKMRSPKAFRTALDDVTVNNLGQLRVLIEAVGDAAAVGSAEAISGCGDKDNLAGESYFKQALDAGELTKIGEFHVDCFPIYQQI